MDKNPNLNELTKEREGYVMRNPENVAEVTCTEKFVEEWKKRGFEVVRKGLIRLMKDEDTNIKSEGDSE